MVELVVELLVELSDLVILHQTQDVSKLTIRQFQLLGRVRFEL